MAPTPSFPTSLPSIEPQATLLNTTLIIFSITLAICMFYLLQRDINAQVEEFRLAALPFCIRLAFARVRHQNAADRLARLEADESKDWTDYVFVVQKRLTIQQYIEIEAEEPLRALEQAEKYRRWWWTGVVNVPALVHYKKEDLLERDSDDDGYWFSDEE